MTPGCRWTIALPTPLVTKLATLGPVGYWGKAPGTLGSIAGLLYYVLIFHHLSPLAYLFLLLVTLYLSVAICGEAEERLMKKDPSEVILDEFACIPICFMSLQGALTSLGIWAWVLLLLGFGLFRLFDITKPLFIRGMQDYPGGWGVMADDVAAAVVTNIILHIAWYAYAATMY